MKKKLFFILITVIFIVSACSNAEDEKSSLKNECANEVVIDAELYLTAPSDILIINNLEIENNCLLINFSASGCTGDTWQIKLIDANVIMESYPPQRNLRLSLQNEEECEKLIIKEISFDIEELQVDGYDKIKLNITNSNQTIVYEY